MSAVSIRVDSRSLGDVTIDVDSHITNLRVDTERAEIAALITEAVARVYRAYGIEEKN